jgi:hypothetical protein
VHTLAGWVRGTIWHWVHGVAQARCLGSFERNGVPGPPSSHTPSSAQPDSTQLLLQIRGGGGGLGGGGVGGGGSVGGGWRGMLIVWQSKPWEMTLYDSAR